MIQTVFFDMGNVLLFFSHQRMCAQIGELFGRSPAEVTDFVIDSRLQGDFEAGRLTPAEFQSRLEHRFAGTTTPEALERASSDIFELNVDIIPILDALRRQNIRLVLLSNTSISHFTWIERNFDVLGRFDACVTSFEVGTLKPDPAIYEAALSVADCPAERCFYTDDLRPNVDAARRFGIRAEVFRDSTTLIEHLRTHGLHISSLTAAEAGRLRD